MVNTIYSLPTAEYNGDVLNTSSAFWFNLHLHHSPSWSLFSWTFFSLQRLESKWPHNVILSYFYSAVSFIRYLITYNLFETTSSPIHRCWIYILQVRKLRSRNSYVTTQCCTATKRHSWDSNSCFLCSDLKKHPHGYLSPFSLENEKITWFLCFSFLLRKGKVSRQVIYYSY